MFIDILVCLLNLYKNVNMGNMILCYMFYILLMFWYDVINECKKQFYNGYFVLILDQQEYDYLVNFIMFDIGNFFYFYF